MKRSLVGAGATALAWVSLAIALHGFGPGFSELVAIAGDPTSWATRAGPEAAVGDLGAVGAWLALAWSAGGAVLVVAAQAPGAMGRAADWVAARVVPAVLRRAVEAALGVALVAASTGPAAWTATAHAAPGPPLARRPAGVPAVVVAPGDSLWTIAADYLGDEPTAAQVDRQWRRWYAANGAVVGPDPDLIHPGQRLTPPPAAGITTPNAGEQP